MAVVAQILDHTPIPGHSFPSANKKRQFTKWVESKEVRKFKFTEYVPRTMDKPEQIEYETGQSYTPRITTTIATQTANNSSNIVVADTTYVRAGDSYKITRYYNNATSGDLNYGMVERGSVLGVTNGTTFVGKRHEGELTSGNWMEHPVGSFVEIYSRGTNFNAAFPDGITWRGDIITNYTQRYDSGEITYDLFAARSVPTYESDNQMLEDTDKWSLILKEYRDASFIEGRKLAGDYSANPKVPYKLGGAIWWAEQKASNIFPVNGVLSPFDFDDAMQLKEETHSDGPPLDMWCGPKTRACIDSWLLPLKEARMGDRTWENGITGIKNSFGSINVEHTLRWPEGTILLCDKSTYSWNNADGMDWERFERGPEILGAYQKSWNMSGDFGFTCNDVQRPILFTGIDTRKQNYLGRQLGW